MAESKGDDQDVTKGGQLKVLSDKDLDSLRDMLNKRLSACGWRHKVLGMVCKMLETRGVCNVTYEDVQNEIVPQARKMVPLYVLKELHDRIRDILG